MVVSQFRDCSFRSLHLKASRITTLGQGLHQFIQIWWMLQICHSNVSLAGSCIPGCFAGSLYAPSLASTLKQIHIKNNTWPLKHGLQSIAGLFFSSFHHIIILIFINVIPQVHLSHSGKSTRWTSATSKFKTVTAVSPSPCVSLLRPPAVSPEPRPLCRWLCFARMCVVPGAPMLFALTH